VTSEAPGAGPAPQHTGPQEQGATGQPGRRVSMASMLPGLIVDVALPIATYYVLEAQGVPTFWALLISGVWPLGKSIISLIRQRRVDEFSVFILTLIILGTLTSLLFQDPRLLLLKDSAFTGILGVVYLASLLMKRPIIFYFGRKFATDGSAAALARWDGFWNLSAFRHGQRVLTGVWGGALLAEAFIRIPLTFILPLNVMVSVSNIMPFIVITALIFWTIRYGRRMGARTRAQAAELAIDR
jgi:hypothetical protein